MLDFEIYRNDIKKFLSNREVADHSKTAGQNLTVKLPVAEPRKIGCCGKPQ